MTRLSAVLLLACLSFAAAQQEIEMLQENGEPLAMTETDEMTETDAETDEMGLPLAMVGTEAESCYHTDKSPEAMTAFAQQKANAALKVAPDTLKTIAQKEYNLALSNIMTTKTGAIANAKKAFQIATTTGSVVHYQLAIQQASLKQQETLHHDMKHVVAKRAKSEADAVAHTKLQMEAIERAHKAEVDLANGLAKRAGEQGQMRADYKLAQDKAAILSKTRASFEKIMKEHKAALEVIRKAAAAKIVTLNKESMMVLSKGKYDAGLKNATMYGEAKTIFDAASAKADADMKHMKARAASKFKVLEAEANNLATNAANQAWVKAFKDEMSFGAPCQAK